MKKGYWLIVIFVIWCFACALWYMFGVKGIYTDPVHFAPQPRLQAILEILFMLLGAFIMGFGLAWLMREYPMQNLREELRNTLFSMREKDEEVIKERNESEIWQARWRQSEEKLPALQQENETRSRQLDESMIQTQNHQRLSKELEVKTQKLDGELTSTRFRIRILENDVAEKDQHIKKMAAELKELLTKPSVNHRDWSDHPFVRPIPADPNEKDNLTEIKGIGPAFQRKLYSMDIFTFRQISELSGEAVERLAEVIEVFPERIHKDNWIGQATKLYLKKLE